MGLIVRIKSLLGLGVIWRRIDHSGSHGSWEYDVLGDHGQLMHQWLSFHQHHIRSFNASLIDFEESNLTG